MTSYHKGANEGGVQMKCEKCNAEFTLKEQAKAKGCCPSCGEKLPASAYCNDAKAWLWYQYRSPMPFSVFLGHIYLIGIVLLALMIAPLSSDWGLWTAMNPTAQFYLVASLPIFLLPLFVFFFMPSARKWRAKCREDAAVYNVAVKSGRLSLRKYQMGVALIGLGVTLVMLVILWDASVVFRKTMTRHDNQNGQPLGTTTQRNFGR